MVLYFNFKQNLIQFIVFSDVVHNSSMQQIIRKVKPAKSFLQSLSLVMISFQLIRYLVFQKDVLSHIFAVYNRYLKVFLRCFPSFYHHSLLLTSVSRNYRRMLVTISPCGYSATENESSTKILYIWFIVFMFQVATRFVFI